VKKGGISCNNDPAKVASLTVGIAKGGQKGGGESSQELARPARGGSPGAKD
jgi:hypothetical protein